MQFGMVGLGRTGANMAVRLMRGGHNCVAYARDPDRVAHVAKQGAVPAKSMADLVGKLQPSRVIWLMLPSGEPTANALIQLSDHLNAGEIAVDERNPHYKDDSFAAKMSATRMAFGGHMESSRASGKIENPHGHTRCCR